MTTLNDIARELGISKSTVSKALNGASDVSKAMQHTVLEKAVEMGYTRIQRSGSVSAIALFITNMDYQMPDDFGYEIVMGFRKAAEPAGYRVEVIPFDRELQNTVHYDTYMMMNHYCGGFFLGVSLLDPWIQEFESCQTPTVLYDNHVSGNPRVSHVGVDSSEAMDLAVDYLKSLGHERIGYLGSAMESFIYRQRYRAYLQAMQDHGMSTNSAFAGTALYVTDCLSQHLPRLLEQKCTAIICSHDTLANSVLVHCRELGVRVPEEISILGFDDIPLCRFTVPRLTTIRQDRDNLGKSAFYALTSQLNHVPIGTLLLHPELMIRDSCGPCLGGRI